MQTLMFINLFESTGNTGRGFWYFSCEYFPLYRTSVIFHVLFDEQGGTKVNKRTRKNRQIQIQESEVGGRVKPYSSDFPSRSETSPRVWLTVYSGVRVHRCKEDSWQKVETREKLENFSLNFLCIIDNFIYKQYC